MDKPLTVDDVRAALVMYPEKASLKDVVKSLRILLQDFEHAIDGEASRKEFRQHETIEATLMTKKAIFEEVRNYVYAHLKLPHGALYDVIALWIVASYLSKDSGKTQRQRL